MKYYAGIGSRKTPKEMYEEMYEIATTLHDKNYILRSGGADGADLYFEAGAGELKEIYIPWKGFNGSNSELIGITYDAMVMAEKYHPNWARLSDAAKKLMSRNCYQILGMDLKTPVEFVVCWTPNGRAEGGTGQALRIANDLDIPIFNLKKENDMRKLKIHINQTRLL